MNRRLYYVLPNIEQTRAIVDELLLKRISIKQIHIINKDNSGLGDLPAASIFQKFDIKRSLIKGLTFGGVAGVCAGIFALKMLNLPPSGLLLTMTLIGAIFGAWSATMIGMMVPNQEIKTFLPDIESGKILLLVDVAKERLEEIETALDKSYPEARFRGEEPTIPSFP